MALFLLALHPEHQVLSQYNFFYLFVKTLPRLNEIFIKKELCRAEADHVFSDPSNYKDGNLQYHALPELKHLERCILESNRMLSISSILMRKLEAPLKLREFFLAIAFKTTNDYFIYQQKVSWISL